LVLHKIKYYDVKGKRIFKTKVKYYAGDLGLLSRILSFDTTKLLSYRLENLVYLELRQRGYEIYTFEDRYEREIDFIAKKDNEIVYYQVTKSLNENNYERESRVLLDRKDGFEKIILTLENESRNNDGIKIINIVDWLLGTKK
jgi:predicted AAA+ superfamily ATPase